MTRRKRLEFSPRVRLEIYQRAGGPDNVRCEKCGWQIRGRNFEIDHKIADWIMSGNDRKPLTAEDGWLLGNRKECGCHGEKTDQEAGDRAHGKRILSKAAKAERKKSRGFRGWTKFDGTPVYAKDR